ncbi:glycosyltransferase family 71 protein [Lepidopterella palustris CBS 459.81]|uniref:Glycosyltransferase family 71 protein n=1 Tax=Lepidopterella palustris CBS 459.81 TaxID=1314670 RepID=A0A8E2E4A8_9PEZI|nr:glycosyltransferase family 71 protein [Lepidopterella palustris CBS 459.81]
MFTRHAHSGAAAIKVVVASFLLIFGLFFFWRSLFPQSNTISLHPQSWSLSRNRNLTAIAYPPELIKFWQELAATLEQAQPQCPPISVPPGPPPDNMTHFDPDDPFKQRPERLSLTPSDTQALSAAHRFMKTRSRQLAPSLYFTPKTKGIVTTAAPRHIPILLVSLRMLRRSGSNLPVEVFLGSWDEYNATICENLLPALNARCRVLSDIYDRAPQATPLVNFQFKIFAILFSSFSSVLFLDADAFPANNPDSIFTHEPYLTHGLVTWPDIFANTASAHYFHIAAIPEVPIHTRLSTESGQLLLNKSLQASTLLLIAYYNYYGPTHYYPLLCQNSHGAGDKETFIHAALALDMPFYQLKTAPWALGHWKNDSFHLIAMGQHDSYDDWSLPAYPIPDKDASLRQTPRPLFIHHHFQKLDPSHLMHPDGPTRDVEGKFQRMWGPRSTIVEAFGRDVEKEVWEEVMGVGCMLGGAQTCEEIKEYYGTVFNDSST